VGDADGRAGIHQNIAVDTLALREVRVRARLLG